MAVLMGKLIYPPPQVISFHMQAYAVSGFPHTVNLRMPVLITYDAIACGKSLGAYPTGKVYLYLLQQPMYNMFIIRSKFGVFGYVNVVGYSVCFHKFYLAQQRY
jgi:hypothetical protein